MKKYIIIVCGMLILAFAYWLIAPLFINKLVEEKIEDITKNSAVSETLSEGNFIGVEGYNAQGAATLIKIDNAYYVRFEDDFQITNGPDLFVYFGKDGTYDSATSMGELKGNSGGQNYKIPANINPLDYNEVWVWCRAFSVGFGKAVLE